MPCLPLALTIALTGCALSGPEAADNPEPEGAITAPVVSIDPVAPGPDQDLSALLLAPAEASLPGAVSYRYAWLRDGQPVAELEGATWVPAEETASGEAWRVEVVAYQGEMEGAIADDEVTIGDGVIEAVVWLDPPEPDTRDDLEASVDAPEGATIEYTWLLDGAPQPEHEGPVLPASATARDDEWTVQIVVTDPSGVGEHEDSTIIVNAPPTLDGAVMEPTPLIANDPALCVPVGFTDPDGDELTYTYQWTLNDGSQTCNCHDPTPPQELDPSFLQAGYLLGCEITASDGQALSENVYSAIIEVVTGDDQ